MDNHDKLQLRELAITPTPPQLEQILGNSYPAYKTLQNALPNLDMTQEWQWYTPHKVWAARGNHQWTTPRGTKKEKTLYWLHVFEGHFSVAVWFKEKNREEVLQADVNETTTQLIRETSTMGKVPTFPVVINITSTEQLTDIFTLLDWKKKLEK